MSSPNSTLQRGKNSIFKPNLKQEAITNDDPNIFQPGILGLDLTGHLEAFTCNYDYMQSCT